MAPTFSPDGRFLAFLTNITGVVAALRKRVIPLEYLRYEDEGHGLARLNNRLNAYPKMVAFLDRYLK